MSSSNATQTKEMDWNSIHTEHCVRNTTFCQTAKALHEVQEGHEDSNDPNAKEESPPPTSQSQQERVTSDEMLTALSHNQCIIVSPSSSSSIIKSLQKINIHNHDSFKRYRYPLFILRSWPASASASASNNTTQEESLLKLFASSLKITNKSTGNGDYNNDNNDNTNARIRRDMVYAASCIIAHNIISNQSQSNPEVHLDAIQAQGPKAEAEAELTTRNTGGGRVRNVSKRMWNRASTALTSIMASYDLVEDPNATSHLGGDFHDIDDDNFDKDDANLYDYNDDWGLGDTVTGGDVDKDDAIANASASARAGKTGTGTGKSSISSHGDSQVNIHDIIWNVKLFMHCWRAILDHAEQIIQRKKEIGDQDGCTTRGGSGNSGIGVPGLILNRYGDDALSFCSFCHEVGSDLERQNDLFIESKLNDYETASSDPTTTMAIARILQRIANGTAVEILVQTLLTTLKAQFSSDEDILILYPSAKPIVDLASSAQSQSRTNAEQVQEVDIAIFKISNAIQTLERRMERMQTQADGAYRKALIAKQGNNTKVALLHLKRRQAYLKEIENCSGSLLNLEGGLHTIQRAKNDSEVLKTYKLMNASMKAIREESGIDADNVEDVMDELVGHGEDLNDIHENIALCGGGIGHDVVTDDELEQELAALMESDVGDACGSDVEEVVEGTGSTKSDFEITDGGEAEKKALDLDNEEDLAVEGEDEKQMPLNA